MSLAAYEDFFYNACLRDWDTESQGMRRLLARFDAADEVRIVGAGTDLGCLREPWQGPGARCLCCGQRADLALA